MDEKITATIDLRNLDWQLLDHLAKQKPMDVARMRERIRQQIIAIAAAHNLPELTTWAIGLTNSALDYLTHFGFLESHFWEGLTGKLGLKGHVAFIGPDTQNKEPDNKQGRPPASDGQHKVGQFTLKRGIELKG